MLTVWSLSLDWTRIRKRWTNFKAVILIWWFQFSVFSSHSQIVIYKFHWIFANVSLLQPNIIAFSCFICLAYEANKFFAWSWEIETNVVFLVYYEMGMWHEIECGSCVFILVCASDRATRMFIETLCMRYHWIQ